MVRFVDVRCVDEARRAMRVYKRECTADELAGHRKGKL